jgi:hypothetical protein
MNYPQIQGLNPNSVNLNSSPYPVQDHQSKLKDILQFGVPVAGSLLGGAVGGPVGMVAGGAGASALLNYLGGGRKGQNPIQAAEQDALFSLLGMGVGKVAGPLVGKVAGKIPFPTFSKVGSEVASGGANFEGKLLSGAGSEVRSNWLDDFLQNIGGTSKPGGGKLGSLGTDIRENVFRPAVKNGAGYEGDVQNIRNLGENLGFEGGPRSWSKQINDMKILMNDSIKSDVSKLKTPIPVQDWASTFGKHMSADDTYDKAFNPTYNKALQEQFMKLMDAAKGGPAGLDRLKSILSKDLYGGVVTEKKAAKLVTVKTIKELMGQYGPPGYTELNQAQNLLNPLATGAQKEADRSFSAPFVGGLGSGIKGGFKAAQDFAGRTAQDLGEAGQTTAGLASKPIFTALGAGVGGVANMGQSDQQQSSPESTTMGYAKQLGVPEDHVSPDGAWVYDGQSSQWVKNPLYQAQGAQGQAGEAAQTPTTANSLQDPNVLASLALKLAIAGKTKESDQLIQLSNLFKGLQPKLTTDQQNKKAQLTGALGIVDELEAEYGKVIKQGLGGNPLSGFGGIMGGKIIGGNEATIYDNLRKGTLAPIIRSLGEKGALSDNDVKRAIALLPPAGTNPQVAAKQFDEIRIILSGSKQSYNTPTSNLDSSPATP